MRTEFLILLMSAVFSFQMKLALADDQTAVLETGEITVSGHRDSGKSGSGLVGGRDWERKQKSSLGESVAQELGVTSSFFGTAASRPVVRGQDGERMKLLQNGVSNLDASSTSPDHAVAGDPFSVNEVEMIRGPRALLWGSSVIGGVLNASSDRIPNHRHDSPEAKVSGQLSSIDVGRSLGAAWTNSVGPWSYHLDGVLRGSNGYVPNSANRSWEGAVGGSRLWGDENRTTGYLGVSFTTFGTRYGTIVEPEGVIDLHRERVDLAGEVKPKGETLALESVRWKAAFSHYKHQEWDGEVLGTTFRNRGGEMRFEADHRKSQLGAGVLEGTWGVQGTVSNFEATGDEAFLPSTLSANTSLSLHERWNTGFFSPELAIRFERSAVGILGDTTPESNKAFVLPQVALGTEVQWGAGWTSRLTVGWTERAPSAAELFAQGPHLATGTYERGRADLKPEISRSMEVTLDWHGERAQAHWAVFSQCYNRYLALVPTGEQDPDLGLNIFQVTPTLARVMGTELSYQRELFSHPVAGQWSMELKWEWLRGRDLGRSTYLPRMAPMRGSVGLAQKSAWGEWNLEVQRVEPQAFVAAEESATAGYTWAHLGYELPIDFGWGELRFSARLHNVFNALARNHASYLKDRVQLPGRNFVVGLQASL